jgi:hypothetical protein
MAAEKWAFGIGAAAFFAVCAYVQAGSFPNPLSLGSGPIHLESHASQSKTLVERNGQPVVLLLGEIRDGRTGAQGRKVGDIRATIIDMSGTELRLDQDISTELSNALRDQLAADGFRTVSDPHALHDFDVEAVAKDFRLDIVDRDELDIGVDMTLRDARTGDVLWSGDVAQKSSRYAGVFGNSRASIVRTFSKGLNAWTAKASANIRDTLFKAYPQTMAVGERRDLVSPHLEGVTTRQEVTSHEPAATASVPGAAAAPVATVPAPAVAPAATTTTPPAAAVVAAPGSGKGIFSVTTTPTNAKVYIDDVYYGTSPLRLELDPGISVFHFKLDGYKAITEKVSIRRAETTALDVTFDK